jgi:hypothetical protein
MSRRADRALALELFRNEAIHSETMQLYALCIVGFVALIRFGVLFSVTAAVACRRDEGKTYG